MDSDPSTSWERGKAMVEAKSLWCHRLQNQNHRTGTRACLFLELSKVDLRMWDSRVLPEAVFILAVPRPHTTPRTSPSPIAQTLAICPPFSLLSALSLPPTSPKPLRDRNGTFLDAIEKGRWSQHLDSGPFFLVAWHSVDRYLMGENFPPCTLDLRHDFESPCVNVSHSMMATAQGVHALEVVSTVSP